MGGCSGGFGELDSSFTDGDVLLPGYMYYIDTSSSPLSGVVGAGSEDGQIITIVDISGSFNTNYFTISASGTTLNDGSTYICDTDNSAYILYYDTTYGWRVTGGQYKQTSQNTSPSD